MTRPFCAVNVANIQYSERLPSRESELSVVVVSSRFLFSMWPTALIQSKLFELSFR